MSTFFALEGPIQAPLVPTSRVTISGSDLCSFMYARYTSSVVANEGLGLSVRVVGKRARAYFTMTLKRSYFERDRSNVYFKLR